MPTVERLRAGCVDDAPQGRRNVPANKFSGAERRVLLDPVNAVAFRELTPHKIAPGLADIGQRRASESTVYCVRRAKHFAA